MGLWSLFSPGARAAGSSAAADGKVVTRGAGPGAPGFGLRCLGGAWFPTPAGPGAPCCPHSGWLSRLQSLAGRTCSFRSAVPGGPPTAAFLRGDGPQRGHRASPLVGRPSPGPPILAFSSPASYLPCPGEPSSLASPCPPVVIILSLAGWKRR